MILEFVSAEGFRNLRSLIECDQGTTILFGENGRGKTNWLEAVYLLANASSFRTSRIYESIGFDEETAVVAGNVRQSENITHELRVVLSGNTKTLTVNGKKETATRFSNELHVLLFNSDQLDVIRGAPSARRAFLDDGIKGIFPAYKKTLSDFQKVLTQKNSLLRNARENEWTQEKLIPLLEPWNEQIVALGNTIHKARVRYVERLNGELNESFFEREEVSIKYKSSLEDKGDLSDYSGLLSERLTLRVMAEMYNGRSLIGPHRDDLEVSFDGREIRKFGSSGQQRSALIVILLAKLSVFFAQNEEYPLFLLDDLDAELDYRRIGKLLEYLNGKSQNFVTTSKESFVERFGGIGRVVEV